MNYQQARDLYRWNHQMIEAASARLYPVDDSIRQKFVEIAEDPEFQITDETDRCVGCGYYHDGMCQYREDLASEIHRQTYQELMRPTPAKPAPEPFDLPF